MPLSFVDSNSSFRLGIRAAIRHPSRPSGRLFSECLGYSPVGLPDGDQARNIGSRGVRDPMSRLPRSFQNELGDLIRM